MMDTGKIASIQGKITDVNSTVEAKALLGKSDTDFVNFLWYYGNY